MEANSATAMDALALVVLLLSSGLALTRGFVRETLSIASFVIASLVTIFTYSVFRDVANNWIESELIATVVTSFVIFIGVYVIMTIITQKLSDIVRRNSHISALDRTAGLAFGIVRGMIMLAIVLLGWNFLAKPEQTPSWVHEARVYPAIHATAEALKSIVPNSRISQTAIAKPVSKKDEPKPETEQGYQQSDRNILDQVVTTRLEEQKDQPETPPETDQ
ncbi:MAG: CvpA family protein [Robiginitomaculum sp.]|nr:CvpA family protein [Robiginitomaculum sp.]